MLYAIIDWARAADSYGKRQIGHENDSAEIGNREAALIAATVTMYNKNNSGVLCITYVNERATSDI